ncbi:MAG: ABC transporter permease subunit [Myxococcota bacterium]|nr:ABC transporter permease subunit [Myxococcota bacterium]
MGRVGRALIWHELLERTRDRWVVVVSLLFALLASGVGLYGRGAEAEVAKLTGPSLVTLASLLVPLVALVLSHDAIVGERERNTLGLLLSLPVGRFEVVFAKLVGRSLALVAAVGLGLGAAFLVSDPGEASALLALIGPTLLLGLAFLSLGLLISTLMSRQVTAASVVVVVWFCLVFFYDLGVLGLLVATDGGLSQQTVSALVFGNPAGLYRIEMMNAFAGPDALRELGIAADLPGDGASAMLWGLWLLVPAGISGILLARRKVV